MTSRLELTLPAIPSSVRTVRNQVAEIAFGLGAGERIIDDIRLCVNEAVANVVLHAYGREQGSVGVSVDDEDDELIVLVRDDGIGLAGFSREHPRGHGLRIIEELTKRCTISSAPNGGTEVRMEFTLDRVAARKRSDGRTSRTVH